MDILKVFISYKFYNIYLNKNKNDFLDNCVGV